MIQRLGKQRQDVFVVQRINDFFAGLGNLTQLSNDAAAEADEK